MTRNAHKTFLGQKCIQSRIKKYPIIHFHAQNRLKFQMLATIKILLVTLEGTIATHLKVYFLLAELLRFFLIELREQIIRYLLDNVIS